MQFVTMTTWLSYSNKFPSGAYASPAMVFKMRYKREPPPPPKKQKHLIFECTYQKAEERGIRPGLPDILTCLLTGQPKNSRFENLAFFFFFFYKTPRCCGSTSAVEEIYRKKNRRIGML